MYLANHAGIDRSFISSVERGQKGLSMEFFFILCEALDADPTQMMGKIVAIKQ